MYSTLPQMLYEKSQNIPAREIQFSKDKSGVFQSINYGDFIELMLDFGAGLLSIGTNPYDHVGLISDNRKEWLVCSMGIMAIGCSDIPRGSEATVKDLSYILSFAECHAVVIESNYSYKKIIECIDNLSSIKTVILIDDLNVDRSLLEDREINVYSYSEFLHLGREYRAENPGKVDNLMLAGKESDTATIIFTSGTTGTPKGVELTHKNFLCQLPGLSPLFPLKTGDKALCVLPVWHVYEREIEYLLLSMGVSLCYSKPVASMILSDMKKIKPQFLACVPRVWDAMYKSIQKQIGATSTSKKVLFSMLIGATVTSRKFSDIIMGRTRNTKRPFFLFSIINKVLYLPLLFMLPFKAWGKIAFFNKVQSIFGGSFKLGMTGGGGIAHKLDRFYNSVGIRLMEGYGLTETAPMCCMRSYKRPVMGTIGRVLPFCEGKIVGFNGKVCKPGQKGVLWIKGPNVMKGYYKQPQLTQEVIKDGWFNTGDLVISTYKGDIMVKGRQKDTIVLRSGENVEPFPIECKLAESPYINQAVVVGQDKNTLGALIIPCKDNIKKYAEENGLDTSSMQSLLKADHIKDLIFSEFERLLTPKNGFKPFEKIGKFCFLDKQFEVGVELSAKQDIIRYKINEIYKWQIAVMYSDSQAIQNLQSLSNIIPGNVGQIMSKIPGLKKEKESEIVE